MSVGPSRQGQQVHCPSVARFERGSAPLAVPPPGPVLRRRPRSASTWRPALALSTAETAVQNATAELRMPEDVRTEFAGNARFLQQSLSTQPLLIAAALDLDLYRAGRAV